MKKSSLYLAVLALFLDVAALLSGFVIAYILRSDGTQLYYWPFQSYLAFVLYVLPFWVFYFASQGLYNARNLPRGWAAFSKTTIGMLSGWGTLLMVLYLWHTPQAQAFPRLVLLYGIVLTTLFCLLGKLLLTQVIRFLYRHGRTILRTVLVSPGDDEFYEELKNHSVHGRAVVARFAPDEAIEKINNLIKTTEVNEIIINDPHIKEGCLLEILNYAEQNNLLFVAVPSLLSVRSTNVAMGTLAGTPIMQFLRTPLEGWQRAYKRIFDLIIVVPAIIILLPCYLIIALLVKISSPGPVIYSHKRVGQDGRLINIHKFRSMYTNAEHRLNITWSMDESRDPRITPIGRILRKTNLDELPQLWDILIGKMSIVGPRPEQPQYVEKFSHEIPGYMKRHHIKTGLTGWAQVNGLRGDTSVAERVKYDLYYIQNWSIWFDIRIIIATVLLMFRQLFGQNGK